MLTFFVPVNDEFLYIDTKFRSGNIMNVWINVHIIIWEGVPEGGIYVFRD